MLLTIALFAFSAAAVSPQAQTLAQSQPPVRDLTLAPETSVLSAIVEGRGVQIYTCTAGADRRFAWSFQAPDAELFNLATGKPVGHHGAGPVWTMEDGSSIRGTVVGKRAGDSAGDVPWLLLQAQPDAATQGTLSHVTYIRRSNTRGGNAPATGCDAAHLGQGLRVPYVATYSFYTDPQFSPVVSGKTPQPPPPAQP